MDKDIAQKINALDDALCDLFNAYADVRETVDERSMIGYEIKRLGRMIETLEDMEGAPRWQQFVRDANV